MSEKLLRLLGRSAAVALLAMNVAVLPAFADTKTEAKPADAKPGDAKPAEPKPAPKPVTPPKKEPADVPAIKMSGDQGKGFLGRHEGFLKDLKAMEGKVELLLVGDSITDGWRRAQDYNNPKSWGGKAVYDKVYGSKYRTLNIGIGGDRTQHVIWRLQNGEVEGISPKVAVLMIGTNNLGGNTDEEIAAGVTKCVTTLREKLPQTKVLLLGIFPRSPKPTDPQRTRITTINTALSKLDDGGKTVKYLDIGTKFLDKDGNLPPDIMPDYLHPNEKGYEIWAAAVQSSIDELMK